MSKVSLVRKLMLPLSEYATIQWDATLRDALLALSEAQSKVKAGHQPHRAVVVFRGDGVVVGKLGYHAILGALRPEQKKMYLDDNLRRAGVSEDMLSTSLASMQMLGDDLQDLCDRACHVLVRNLVLAPPYTIDIDAAVNELLDTFLRTEAHSLLVVEDGDVVGILRITDLFDEVTRISLADESCDCAEDAVK